MGCNKDDAGLPGAYHALAREVCKLMVNSSPSGSAKKRHRRFQLETLEPRQMMDAAAAATLLSPLWFQNVSTEAAGHAGTALWTAADTIEPAAVETFSSAASDVYDWIVQFDTAALDGISSVAQTTSLLAGGGIEFEAIRGLGLAGQVLVRSSGASLEAVQNWLRQDAEVASFEQDAYRAADRTANDPQAGSQWALTKISAQNAWNISTGSSSVVVGVIDTGIDYNHVDLAANIWTNAGEVANNGIDDDGNGFVDDIHGYDFVNRDGSPLDDNGHGTHVAGTIAAVGNNGVGVTGVTWSTQVMAMKFMDANGSGYLSDAISAVNYATMMRSRYGVNVRVTNNSWGGGSFSSALQNAIRASNSAGILFVAAAGNSGTNNDSSPQYPANYDAPNVISVAATNQNDQLASFSNYGAVTVDIAAPGVSIYSTGRNNLYATMSGTSMASPHVAAAAALAWAVNPNATVASVRDAILRGADPISSLSGKVVTGGRLNLYNTVRLIGGSSPSGPVMTSLTVSPGTVQLGSAITITGHGLSDSSGTITGLYVSWDANGDGIYQATDPTVGMSPNVVNGEATLTLDTSRFGVGTQRFFAAALNSNGQWSALSTVTLTVLPADDHGNSAANATTVGIPSTTIGSIAVIGDTDWFAIQAIAGQQYTFTTQLGSLRDSILTLYNRNGTSQLTTNDDYGSTYASQIKWTAPATGTYYLVVASYGHSYTGTYSLDVKSANVAPVLAAISDRVMSRSQTSIHLGLTANDANGDQLAYTAQAFSVDPLAKQAYDLNLQLQLYQWQGSYWTNLRGYQEKYLASYTNGLAHPCFLMPNGDLYRWESSITNSTLIANVGSACYANPALLHNAAMPTYTPISSNNIALNVSGGSLTVNRAANFTNDFYVRVTVSDGMASVAGEFKVSVANSAPVLSSLSDRMMAVEQTSLSVSLNANDGDGDPVSYTAQALAVDPLEKAAYDLNQQLRLYQWQGSYWTNLRGYQEKYLASYTNGLAHPCFILPNGDLYRWDGSIANSTRIATLNRAYYDNPALLHEAAAPSYRLLADSVAVGVSGNVLTVSREAGYTSDFYVQVTASDGMGSTTQTFKVVVAGASPSATALANRLPPTAQRLALARWLADSSPSSAALRTSLTNRSTVFDAMAAFPGLLGPSLHSMEVGRISAASGATDWHFSARLTGGSPEQRSYRDVLQSVDQVLETLDDVLTAELSDDLKVPSTSAADPSNRSRLIQEWLEAKDHRTAHDVWEDLDLSEDEVSEYYQALAALVESTDEQTG